MADQLGRLLDPYPIALLFVHFCCWMLLPRHHYPPHTPSAMSVCLGLVQIALCGKYWSHF
jgi:hypothetical protein